MSVTLLFSIQLLASSVWILAKSVNITASILIDNSTVGLMSNRGLIFGLIPRLLPTTEATEDYRVNPLIDGRKRQGRTGAVLGHLYTVVET